MAAPRAPAPSVKPPPPEAPVATSDRHEANPYVGAAARQLNVRMLEPLALRYRDLARHLESEGLRTTMTELLHAALHEGPTTTQEARAALRRWRRLTQRI